MLILDDIMGTVVLLDKNYCDVALSEYQVKTYPLFNSRYFYSIKGDFLKYIKRV